MAVFYLHLVQIQDGCDRLQKEITEGQIEMQLEIRKLKVAQNRTKKEVDDLRERLFIEVRG